MRYTEDGLTEFWLRRTQLWFSKRNLGVAPTPRERWEGGFGGRAATTLLCEKMGASPVGWEQVVEERNSKTHRTLNPTYFYPRSHQHPPHWDGIPAASPPMPGRLLPI